MSIGKQQIIHIVSEVVIITGISIYFQLKIRNLNSAIERLENKIEQQDQVIQNHEQLLLRIMNNVDSMNNNISEMRKSFVDDKKSNSSVKTIKKDKPKTISKSDTSVLSQQPPVFHQPVFYPPKNENIFVMEIKPIEKQTSSHKIEEILEEKNNEDLDRELEKELQELENEIDVEGECDDAECDDGECDDGDGDESEHVENSSEVDFD
jgi:hypothetical protein